MFIKKVIKNYLTVIIIIKIINLLIIIFECYNNKLKKSFFKINKYSKKIL